MGRFAVAKTKILMLREAKRSVERPISKIAGADRETIEKSRKSSSNSNCSNDIKDSWCWVPHPKSGIYFPEGHEWVMKDVPDGAASLNQTYWLRNVEGVDKPEPSEHEYFSSDHHYSHANMYDHSAAHAVSVVISVLVFHFLLAGILLPTCCWFLTNAYLREEAPNTCVVEQQVEWQVWLYAFDVHCNSFFPMFVMLYVIHYFLSPLLVAHGFIPALLSNLLFMVAASYHHYLNFLGYDVLPFLERTTFFFYPIGIVIILSPILILSEFNPSRYFMNIYFSRTL